MRRILAVPGAKIQIRSPGFSERGGHLLGTEPTPARRFGWKGVGTLFAIFMLLTISQTCVSAPGDNPSEPLVVGVPNTKETRLVAVGQTRLIHLSGGAFDDATFDLVGGSLVVRIDKRRVVVLTGFVDAAEGIAPPEVIVNDGQAVSSASLLASLRSYSSDLWRREELPISGDAPDIVGLPQLSGKIIPVSSNTEMAYGSRSNAELFHVSYITDEKDGRLTITPTVPYRELVFHQQPIVGLDVRARDDWVPHLDIEVANDAKSQLRIAFAKVEINSSAIDERPIPIISYASWQSVIIRNEGWGPMRDTTVSVGFVSDEECRKDTTVLVSVSLVKVGMLKEVFVLDLLHDDIPSRLRSEPIVCAAGVLEYMDETGAAYALPFRTAVLREESTVNPPPTSRSRTLPVPPTIQLDSDQAEYSTLLPLDHVVEPGRVAEISIAIASDRTASFSLRVTLLDEHDRVVWESPIDLAIFRARNALEPWLDDSLGGVLSRP
jgi:hypothetical protein